MKTAHEWMQIEQTEGHPHVLCPSIIRAIQLDAMRGGAGRILRQLRRCSAKGSHASQCAVYLEDEAANWTEADL